eukprot:2120421-Pleurochrysis_carterae.AAC.1
MVRPAIILTEAQLQLMLKQRHVTPRLQQTQTHLPMPAAFLLVVITRRSQPAASGSTARSICAWVITMMRGRTGRRGGERKLGRMGKTRKLRKRRKATVAR